jgi:hypothetical protein
MGVIPSYALRDSFYLLTRLSLRFKTAIEFTPSNCLNACKQIVSKPLIVDTGCPIAYFPSHLSFGHFTLHHNGQTKNIQKMLRYLTIAPILGMV